MLKASFLFWWCDQKKKKIYNVFFSRIYELLPPKIQQWQSSPCVTEENNKKTLEKIRRQQLETRQKLAELDYKHQELDAVIERAKQTTISHDQDVSSLYIVTQSGLQTPGIGRGYREGKTDDHLTWSGRK